MQGLFEIASRISTPLALAGLFAATFFLIVRQIIKKNIFPTLTRQLSGDILRLIIDRLFVLSLVAMVLGFAGFVVTRLAAGGVNDDKMTRARSLLVGYDSRIMQLASVARQINDAQTPYDKGNLTLCLFHLLKGTGVCNGGVQITPMVAIVNQLTTLDAGVDPTAVLTTLNDMESERGENIVPTDHGDRGVYPPGLLDQRLDSLRAYSREAWKHVGGKPTGSADATTATPSMVPLVNDNPHQKAGSQANTSKKPKVEESKSKVPPSPAVQPTFSVTNPSGSIINQGSSVNAPQTVNNFAPPPAKITTWDQKPAQWQEPEGLVPETQLTLTIDHSMEIPAFAVKCDRPCRVREAVVFGGYNKVNYLTTNDPNIAGAVFLSPRPLGAGVQVEYRVRAQDGTLPKILEVSTIRSEQLK